MVSLPQGVPYIDILGPSDAADDLQTRIDLLAGPGWRVFADDGTMENGPMPMQPLRGDLGRIWVVRGQPFHPGESFQGVAGVAVEAAIQVQATVAAAGVAGLYSWGVLVMEDPRWLYGLALLDWTLNPRLAEDGSLLETDDPQVLAEAFQAKTAAFSELFTLEKALSVTSRLPPGSLQRMGSYHALALLGPDGSFDPRLWQMLAMELVLPQVQARAGIESPPGSPFASPKEAAGMAPSGSAALSAAEQTPAPASPSPPSGPMAPTLGAQSPSPSGEAVDGLTPLARAQREAERKAAERAATKPDVAEAEVTAAGEVSAGAGGPVVSWLKTDRGMMLWVPPERYDPAVLRALRDGESTALSAVECPTQQDWEVWLEAGAPFATEVPFLSRLFHDNVPLHKARFEELSAGSGEPPSVLCHLPRVARVRAVRCDGGVAVSSELEWSGAEVQTLRLRGRGKTEPGSS